MTLTQLRYVIAAADTGSMNEAAKKLFISQPSLSQALRELEKEIGIEIFLRNNRARDPDRGGQRVPGIRKAGDRAV